MHARMRCHRSGSIILHVCRHREAMCTYACQQYRELSQDQFNKLIDIVPDTSGGYK
jgi:hypothetical protein